jgi:formylglycine-generating enzyme required for sulfatase activity
LESNNISRKASTKVWQGTSNGSFYGECPVIDINKAIQWRTSPSHRVTRFSFSLKAANRKILQSWSEKQITDLVQMNRITSRQAHDWTMIRNCSEDDFETTLEDMFPSGKRYSTPVFWNDQAFNNPAQPVVGVCLYEVCAYCAWLSAQADRLFRLPTEAEFEAAARGIPGWKYPYGENFDATRSNTFESHIRRTSPVGIFANATPEGVFDLIGNVYTWTSSALQSYPYQAKDGRDDPNRTDAL